MPSEENPRDRGEPVNDQDCTSRQACATPLVENTASKMCSSNGRILRASIALIVIRKEPHDHEFQNRSHDSASLRVVVGSPDVTRHSARRL